MKYNVSFPLFSKISVKAKKIHPLYKFLTEKETSPRFGDQVRWNFNKFVIDKGGEIVARFDSKVEPLDERVLSAVDAAVNKPSA